MTRPPGGISVRRHLEGWQAGLVAVALAGGAGLLAIPRPVPPGEVPLPRVDRRELGRQRAEDELRADRAERERLPVETRAVGELVRRIGKESSEGLDLTLVGSLRDRVRVARAANGDEALLALRAVQGRFFLRAVERWERTGVVDDELRELGGEFPERAEASGWRGRSGLDRDERLALFRVRWTELAGLRDTPPFAPTLDELRRYWGALLRRPEQNGPEDPADRARRRLRYVAVLARKDPTYPAAYAQGVLAYQAGDPATSVRAFEGYLAANPTGPFRLRAVNHLLAARRESGEQ